MRAATCIPLCPGPVVSDAAQHHGLSAVRGAGLGFGLIARVAVLTAWMLVVATIPFVQPVLAESYEAHTDVEFRVGGGVVCGTCANKDSFPWRIKTTAQLLVDRLFPVATIGNGAFEIGPYAKGAMLDGMNIPQVAGGVMFGYRQGQYEVLANVGLAYATERIGEIPSGRSADQGQSKHTYDLGLSLRYDIDRYFITAGYQHNSNGEDLGVNFSSGKGSNHGYDTLNAGVGIHF